MPSHRLQNLIHPPYTEGYNFGTNLGIIGGLGLVVLLSQFLFGRVPISQLQLPRGDEVTQRLNETARSRLLSSIGLLTLACLLLATTGGFGYLFSWLLTPWIRCYYRISIFFAFLCLFGLLLVLDKVGRLLLTWRGGKLLYCALNIAVIAIGLLDQTSVNFIPPYEVTQAEFQSDRKFVEGIEARIPGQAVFQLPHVPWPEYSVCQTNSYEVFRGYLHSKSLRWSGGAVKGRPADYWGREVSCQPAEIMARTLGLAGFSGIYLDRNGYNDRGAAMETQLTRLLGQPALVSANQRLLFFDLIAHNQNLRSRLTQTEWIKEQNEVLSPLSMSVSFKGGFSYLDHSPQENWRWCSGKGILEIANFTGLPRNVCLEMTLTGSDANMSNLWIDGPSLSEHLLITGAKAVPFRKTLTLPPGRNAITFHCDGKPLNLATDQRELVFRVHDLRILSFSLSNDSADDNKLIRQMSFPSSPGN